MSNNNLSIGGNANGPVAVGDGATAISENTVSPGRYGRSGREPARPDPDPRVFISYQRVDQALVDPIVAELRAAGIGVWFDRDLAPGVTWTDEVYKAIRTCKAFVACFSPRYFDRARSYMNEELRQATQQRRLMQTDARWLVPILLEPCDLPNLRIDSVTVLTDIQHVDFSSDWDTAMAKLVAALKA